MENQKNNKKVIVLLIVIIVLLTVLCVLFAIGTIAFNLNNVDNNNTNQNAVKNDILKLDSSKDWVYDATYSLPTDKESYHGYSDHSKLISASDLVVYLRNSGYFSMLKGLYCIVSDINER